MSKEDSDIRGKGFVSRWSRRKSSNPDIVRDVPPRPDIGEAEPAIPLNTITPQGSSGRMLTGVEADRIAAESVTQSEPEKELTDRDMPAIDSLNENSDYTGFMSSGVSTTLRKLALRKLFAVAGFNIRDGLDDYDDDFTNFEPLGDIVTSDMKHRQEMEEKRRQEALADEQKQKEAAEADAEQQLAQNEDGDQNQDQTQDQTQDQNNVPPADDGQVKPEAKSQSGARPSDQDHNDTELATNESELKGRSNSAEA